MCNVHICWCESLRTNIGSRVGAMGDDRKNKSDVQQDLKLLESVLFLEQEKKSSNLSGAEQSRAPRRQRIDFIMATPSRGPVSCRGRDEGEGGGGGEGGGEPRIVTLFFHAVVFFSFLFACLFWFVVVVVVVVLGLERVARLAHGPNLFQIVARHRLSSTYSSSSSSSSSSNCLLWALRPMRQLRRWREKADGPDERTGGTG